MFWKNKYEKRIIKLLEENLTVQKEIAESLRRHSVIFVAHGVRVVFLKSKGDKNQMADLTLKNGQTCPVSLHYVDAQGNDLGPVPASDNPVFTVNDPASIGIANNADGSAVITDTHSGDSDVDVQFVGSAKGFSDSKVVTCKGVAPPPVQPVGVKVVFGTPSA